MGDYADYLTDDMLDAEYIDEDDQNQDEFSDLEFED